MELLLIADLCRDLCRCLQDLQDPGQQVDAAHRGLGGIFMIGIILLVMNYNHPFTRVRVFISPPPRSCPTSRAGLSTYRSKPNAPLKEGDVLFRIDPTPYQYVVDQKKALLAEAETERQAAQGRLRPSAGERREDQSPGHARAGGVRPAAQLFEKKVIAQAQLDIATRNVDAAKQALAESRRPPKAHGSLMKLRSAV